MRSLTSAPSPARNPGAEHRAEPARAGAPADGALGPAASRSRRRTWPLRHSGASLLAQCALVVVLAVLAGLGFEVGTGRWHATPVLSGSMRPGVQPGDLAVTQRVPVDSLAVRDVLVFRVPGSSELRVHRIVALDVRAGTTTIATRGDANLVDDPLRTSLAGATAYRVVRVVPLLGYPAVWLRNGGRDYVVILAGLLLIGAAVAGLRSASRRATGDTAPAEDRQPSATDGPASVSAESRCPSGAELRGPDRVSATGTG